MKLNMTSTGACLHQGKCTDQYQREYLAWKLEGRTRTFLNYIGEIEFWNVPPADVSRNLRLNLQKCWVCKKYVPPKWART